MKSKLFTALSLVLALQFGASTLTAQNADAYLLIRYAAGDIPPHGDRPGMIALTVVLCIIALPICILDENADADATKSPNALSPETLSQNGYEAQEIDQILKGQLALVNHLEASELRVELQEKNSAAQIKETLSAIDGMTKEYIDFSVETLGN